MPCLINILSIKTNIYHWDEPKSHLPLGIFPWLFQNLLKITFSEIKLGILLIRTPLSSDSPISLDHAGLKNSHLGFLSAHALALSMLPSQNIS